ncbi:MAG: NAD(P)-dependent oxidoreductase [Phycisphaerales bacterium]|nr:NAD(P)-dependent oxidoreductase [Phycisphaerales bacterium]
MDRATVGLIGTGIMGVPMALNLIKAGHPVRVHSRTRARAKPVLDAGASWCDSPRRVAESADVVITVLPDSPDVEAVYLGPDAVCAGLRSGGLAIDMSTVSPETARRVDEAVRRRGGSFLDAPVSGGKTGAEAGTLVIMAGGEPDALERAMPVLQAVGKTVVHCGPCGSGQLTKLCNQIICGLNLLAVGEAIVFAKSVGLDPTVMLRVVSGGAAGSWAVEHLGTRMVRRDFAPMFMIDLQQKDLRLALEAARGGPVPLPGTSLVHQLLASNQAMGEGREGTQALVKTLERLARMGDGDSPES